MPLLGCWMNNLTRTPKEAYSMTDLWWRACVSSEMYDGIANFQSLYKRTGVRSLMDLLRHRMSLVILLDKAQHVHHQLRARFPTIRQGWIPAPPDEVTRPTSLLIAVVQQALHEEALSTARINQWMRRSRKHVLRRVCRFSLIL